MRFKCPTDVEVGDVFEDPETEEDFHGRTPRPEKRGRYRVEEKQSLGRTVTAFLVTRLSDDQLVEIRMGNWVQVPIVSDGE